MTGFSIGEILPYAIGIALSPVPIIAVILMLLLARARENGPAFLAGWVIGIAVLTTVIVIIAKMFGADSDEDASDLVDWIKIVLGLGMLVLAYKQWQTRPAAGEAGARSRG